jgi:hypothetical protein
VVVVAIPLLIVLFDRVEAYYRRAGEELGAGEIPGPPERQRTVVVVPVTSVSRLTRHAISEALSLGDEVVAVTVVFDGMPAGLPDYDVEGMWARWDPGVALRVLHTEYASITDPIVGLVDELLDDRDRQVVVLIPVVVPERLRYRLLHNQVDLALARELRRRPEVVVARVPMPIRRPDDDRPPPEA